MTYSEKIQEQLKGKTIKSAQVDGDGITLTFTDESRFDYEASDGGYSTFSFSELKGDNKQSRCNNCQNNTDELSGECYECVKGIEDWYEPISEMKGDDK